ncbi:hypothetical protein [Caldilinea sp.]|uniref:hypothetical protein n=1 Tax=Caldilinea sp. TaxID=2293560 RepID=UPI002B912057|nr:hypothetical protein [Anaerolineales bacterium]HQY94537.1 hypothetical protein [Caldilinea sp.]HRA68088.1 hypothetical protein [Caldilinea sp.]
MIVSRLYHLRVARPDPRTAMDGVSNPTAPMTPDALSSQIPVGALMHYGQAPR